jgi:hypothetical protein
MNLSQLAYLFKTGALVRRAPRKMQKFHFCSHRNTSRVFSVDDTTYVVCLDCGRKFHYSWAEMRRGAEIREARHEQPKVRV